MYFVVVSKKKTLEENKCKKTKCLYVESWNFLPAEYFRLTYDLDSRVDRHLFSLGFF